ncbi:MAG TPA: hypothetical protein VIM07_00765 [Chitinophagaceae bacterium]
MDKTLAGCTFIRNGIEFDYCFIETIKSIQKCCDHVFIVDAGSDDGTVCELKKMQDNKTTIIYLSKLDWDNQHGKEKLSYFSNIAIQAAQDAGYEYQLYIQCDEIIHENSYSEVRRAIEQNNEAYMCSRINLWKSCYMKLDVPLNKMPCSISVIRLTKTKYRCVGDAESLDAPANLGFINNIIIYHVGFVRKREVMKSKIINMQQGVFAMEHYDSKLDQCEIFNPDLWFNPKTDLKPIDEPLPKLIQQWAKERIYE